MTDILSLLSEKFQGKYDYLRLGDVKIGVEEKKASVTFLVPEDIYDYSLNNDDIQAIKKAITEALGSGFSVYCRFEKIVLTEETVRSALIEFMAKNCPLIAANVDFSKLKVEIQNTLKFSFSVQKNIREYMELVGFDKRIKDFFRVKYVIETSLDYEITDDAPIVAATEGPARSGRYGKSVEVTDKILVFGKMSDLNDPAVHIATLKGEGEDAVCCGKINYLSFKSRDESKKDEFKKFFKHYYTFSIGDTTGYLNIFINTDTEYPALQNGSEVVVRGRVRTREETGNLSMYVKSLAFCKIPFSVIEEQTKPLDPPENYSVLTPKEYHEVSYDQIGFDFFKPKTTAHANLTPGLVLTIRGMKTEKFFVPYEIAMIKVANGRITEYLHTYLKVAFSDGSEKAEFANKKGYGSPRLSTVIPDLIKFSAGELVIGLNPSASLDLLNMTAKPLRYQFRNDVHVLSSAEAKDGSLKKGDALEEAIALAHIFLKE